MQHYRTLWEVGGIMRHLAWFSVSSKCPDATGMPHSCKSQSMGHSRKARWRYGSCSPGSSPESDPVWQTRVGVPSSWTSLPLKRQNTSTHLTLEGNISAALSMVDCHFQKHVSRAWPAGISENAQCQQWPAPLNFMPTKNATCLSARPGSCATLGSPAAFRGPHTLTKWPPTTTQASRGILTLPSKLLRLLT